MADDLLVKYPEQSTSIMTASLAGESILQFSSNDRTIQSSCRVIVNQHMSDCYNTCVDLSTPRPFVVLALRPAPNQLIGVVEAELLSNSEILDKEQPKKISDLTVDATHQQREDLFS